MQSLDQENPSYASAVCEYFGGGSTSVLRVRDLADTKEMGLGGSLVFEEAAVSASWNFTFKITEIGRHISP